MSINKGYPNNQNIDLNENFDYFTHFQISDDKLLPIYTSKNNHNEINSFLRRNKYDKFISIEMVDTGKVEDLVKSIKYVKEKYSLQ